MVCAHAGTRARGYAQSWRWALRDEYTNEQRAHGIHRIPREVTLLTRIEISYNGSRYRTMVAFTIIYALTRTHSHQQSTSRTLQEIDHRKYSGTLIMAGARDFIVPRTSTGAASNTLKLFWHCSSSSSIAATLPQR